MKTLVLISLYFLTLFSAYSQIRELNQDLNLNGNELHNAVINSFDDLTAMDAFALANTYGVDHKGILASSDATAQLYIWDGSGWLEVGKLSDAWRNAAGQPAFRHNDLVNHAGAFEVIWLGTEIKAYQDSVIIRKGDGVIRMDDAGIIINNGQLWLPNN